MDLYNSHSSPLGLRLIKKHTLRIFLVDDNVYESDKVQQHYLRDALDAIPKGHKVQVQDTEPIGGIVKWK